MNFVASLKGISGARRESVKRLIMETLELNFFKDTIAKNLSGGNKRKLCCAQALMLCPKVLFLDEPTSGVDPVSRRSLNRMVKKMTMASVLLTTHRMDEAEQLCDKIAIMINGRFVVFGSPNYLKTQYGQGYTIALTQDRVKFRNPQTNILNLISS
jgi:ATP-binding cassette subfamily A (ABC1) protein 3